MDALPMGRSRFASCRLTSMAPNGTPRCWRAQSAIRRWRFASSMKRRFCACFARRRTAHTQYPVACAPQAWASACVFALVEACLGLKFDHEAGELRLNCPRLPGFLEHVQLRGLRLNGASADVLLHRVSGEISATVTECQGDLPVVITH